MVRRKENLTCHAIYSNETEYRVMMERLKNGTYGQPRWKATIFKEPIACARTAYVYTFQGHYYNEFQEACWILGYHEEEMKKGEM